MSRSTFIGFYFIFLFAFSTTIESKVLTEPIECSELPKTIKDDIASHAPTVEKIIKYFTDGEFKGELWKRVADFVDKYGSRISGSQSLEDAIDYIVAASNLENLTNVHKEPVKVPKWERNGEKLTMLKPRLQSMQVLGLGLSTSTLPGGVTAQAVVVKSFDELKALSDDKVRGKIVVYDQPYEEYGITVAYRSKGASEAAKKGAVAALVRTIAPFSISSPHTGMQDYEDGVAKIPVASITLEDADLLWRLQARSLEIVLRLEMNCTISEAVSHNVVSELKGTEDKIVIVSGHIDSWDVGQGAMDDADGAMLSWLAPIAIKNLGLKPRRTIRSIFFTGEEQGYVGAIEYERANRNEEDKIAFVMESDFGVYTPRGVQYLGHQKGECVLKEILKLFHSINATELYVGDAGPDISVWTDKGIPGSGLFSRNEKYFWFHHSNGDTMNVLDEHSLDLSAALWTGFTYVIANLEYEIPRITPTVSSNQKNINK